MMGANLSYEDFSTCSTASSRTSFPYQPSCISSSTPSLRISSAPAVRASMRSRAEKVATPPPSSLPPPPPPPPASPLPLFDGKSLNRDRRESQTKTTSTTGEMSRSIRIESIKSPVAMEMALSCPTVASIGTSPYRDVSRDVTSMTSMISVTSSVPRCRQIPVQNGTDRPPLMGAGPWTERAGPVASGAGPNTSGAASRLSATPVRDLLLHSHSSDRKCSDCFCAREVELLRNETQVLRAELVKSRQVISQMKDKEKQLRHRLSEQARRQLERGSTKFEDISLGENRPSQLIRRYGNLYSDGRLEAMDALDELQEVAEFNDLKEKLLLSVVVLAFRNARKHMEEMKVQVRQLLHISDQSTTSTMNETCAIQKPRPLPSSHPAVTELDEILSVYLRKTVDHQNLAKSFQEVRDRVWATLYDFPKLRFCRGLQKYIEDCVRLAWALTIQNPPFVVDYKVKVFSPEVHTRFHTSDPDSHQIRSVLWPALREGSETGPCVYKGVVVT